MPEQYVIVTESLSRDPEGRQPLPTLIGPFESRDSAAEWVQAQAPLWGSWLVTELAAP
jgi:hypothetical protein